MLDQLYIVPLWAMALCVFIGSFALAAVILCLAELAYRTRAFRGWTVLSPALVGVVGACVALFLSFLANAVWSQGSRANEAVSREAGALWELSYLSGIKSPEGGGSIRAAVREYAKLTTVEEWPLLARRESSAQTTDALLHLIQTVIETEVAPGHEETIHQALFQAVTQVQQSRDLRIAISQESVGSVKWLAVFALALVTMLSLCMTHPERRQRVIALFLFATAFAVCIITIVAHDRPFVGEYAVSSAPIARFAKVSK